MVRNTSKKALQTINGLQINRLEKKILKTVLTRKDMTRQEISRATGISINSVCGRVNRMVEYGVLDETRKRACRITGFNVWALSA